jgi:outer membrane protein assembly complex protein YaeT
MRCRHGRILLLVLGGAYGASRLPAQEVHPPERTVTAVRFEGNRVLADDTLAAAIATSASSWNYTWPLRALTRWIPFGDRRGFDETEFRRDAVRIVLLYRQHGYYEARVDTAVRRGGDEVAVTFSVTEGPPVIVEALDVTGTGMTLPEALAARGLPLRRGRPFNRLLFDASSDSLTRLLRDLGHPFVAVYRSYSVDRGTRTARAEYAVEAGPRARVGAILIEGLQRVRESTVRRQLAVREGDLYSQRALIESQRSLYQSDLFRTASVSLAPDSLVRGQDSLIRLRVRVAEAAPMQMRVGAGYGTIDCFRVSSAARARGFLGSARLLDVSGRLSKIGVGQPIDWGLEQSLCPELASDQFSKTLNYLLDATLTQPSPLVRRSQLALSATLERRSEFNAYLFQSVGGRVALNLGFGRAVPLTVAYRLARERTQASSATYCVFFNQCDPSVVDRFQTPVRSGSVTASAAWRNVDSPVYPTNGHALSLEGTIAARALGSQVVFRRLVGEATSYQRLGRGASVAFRLRGGIVYAGVGTFGDTALRYVPPSDRFYLGGPSNVRGFARNEMGPQVYVADSAAFAGLDGNGDSTFTFFGVRASPTGSNAVVLGNAELRVPTGLWAGRLVLAAYVDAAKLWQELGTTFLPGRFQVTPGVGLQINTPLGPVRLDAAYNGYGTQPGPLYQLPPASDTTGTLIPRGQYARSPSAGFLSRIQWLFSVGLAY